MSGSKQICITTSGLACLFLWSILCGSGAKAQGATALRQYADSLISLGQSTNGAHELLRYAFWEENTVEKTKALFEVGEMKKEAGLFEESLIFYEAVIQELRNDSIYTAALKQKGLVLFLKGDYNSALKQFEMALNSAYEGPVKAESEQLKLLSLNCIGDWEKGEALAIKMFGNEPFGLEEIRNNYDRARNAKLKRPKTARIMSYFLPGSGQFYAGKPGRGTLSLVLVYGGAALSLAGIMEGRILLGLLSGGSMTNRFYTGGARYAESLAEQWNEAQKLEQAQILNVFLLEKML